MWKHDDYLLWVCINNMSVIQCMCGISLKLGSRRISHLATPFTLTVWEFFCPVQRASPVLVGCSWSEAGVLLALPGICSIWQLTQAQVFSGPARIQAAFFVCVLVHPFWGEGKKLNKTILYPEFTGSLVLSVGTGPGWESFDQRPGSLIVWK